MGDERRARTRHDATLKDPSQNLLLLLLLLLLLWLLLANQTADESWKTTDSIVVPHDDVMMNKIGQKSKKSSVCIGTTADSIVVPYNDVMMKSWPKSQVFAMAIQRIPLYDVIKRSTIDSS